MTQFDALNAKVNDQVLIEAKINNSETVEVLGQITLKKVIRCTKYSHDSKKAFVVNVALDEPLVVWEGQKERSVLPLEVHANGRVFNNLFKILA